MSENLLQRGVSAVVGDITKNTIYQGLSQDLVNKIFGFKIDIKKASPPTKTTEKYQAVIPEYALKKKTYDVFVKEKKGKNIEETIQILKDPKNEEVLKFYSWKYYIDIKINKKHRDIAREEVIYDIIRDIDTDSMKIEDSHKKELYDIVDNKIIQFARTKEREMENTLKKMPTKESNMTFKHFFESKNIKEGAAEIAQKQAMRSKVDAAKADAKAAQDEAKAGTIAAKEKEKQAKLQAKNVMVAEGTYAGADGVSKKIPFTQNPTLQPQAVGPKDKDSKEDKDTESDDGSKDRKEKLEKITKELQALADDACAVAKDNIDATEDTLIAKIAAKEYKSLKEGATSWEEMEKHLAKLEESGCAGGVCAIGAGAPDMGVGRGAMTISPMGSLGLQTQPVNSQVPQVADRSTIYNFIKNNDLHRTNRDYALNMLLSQYGNSQTELSTILSDAILSDGNPSDIDASYGYQTDTFSARFDPAATAYPPEDTTEVPQTDYTQDGDFAQASQMSKAWKDMENKLNELKDL
jgi:hypothetical protein